MTDLSAFAEAPTAAATTKSTRPVINDPALAPLVDQVYEAKEKTDALKGAIVSGTAAIREKAFPTWLKHNGGGSEFETSVEVEGSEHSLLMIFSKGYRSGADPKKVTEAIGGDDAEAKAKEFFRSKFELKLNGDAIPEEKRDEVVAGIVEVLTKAGLSPAKVVTAKQMFIPKPDFNERRATEFSYAQNVALDAALKTPTAVKNK